MVSQIGPVRLSGRSCASISLASKKSTTSCNKAQDARCGSKDGPVGEGLLGV